MIADVVFDLPLDHPFSYRVPADLSSRIRVGQRVRAPLKRRPRLGVVVALRSETDDALEPILEAPDPAALLSSTLVELARRVASESLASWGSVCAALLPPPRTPPPSVEASPGSKENPAPPRPEPPILLIGGDREERLLDLLRSADHRQGFLLIAPEIEDAESWAGRLETALSFTPLRLHSGRPDRERYASWIRLTTGHARAAVTTRAGLFAPIPLPSTLAVVDEHDPAHKSPASPRLHSRDLTEWRASAEGHRLLLTSATPSLESWWRAEDGQFRLCEGSPAAWPEVSVVDLKENTPTEPFSRPLRQAIREALARDSQVLLLSMRLGYAPILGCEECGFSPRCPDCRIGLTFRRTRELRCQFCRRVERAPALCPRCHGRSLTARGWGTERMEEATRVAFPGVPLIRYDGESARGARGARLRRLVAQGEARLVVGTRSTLRLFQRGALGAVGVISPDPLLHLPDFRAAERMFQLLWEVAERVGVSGGRLIVQTHHPDHYAVGALARQDLSSFYQNELKFRAELAYPPFSRLGRIVVRGRERAGAQALAERISRDLARVAALTTYGPTPLGPAARSQSWQLLVKGDRQLPVRLRPCLQSYLMRRGSHGATVEVDMDPLELF